MSEIFTADDLAKRWKCSVGRIRNTPSDELPPRLQLPGSRLSRWRLADVERWEAQFVESRQYGGPTSPTRGSPSRRRKSRTSPCSPSK